MQTRKILIIDDDPDIRELLQAILERFGVPYSLAASPEEARKVFQKENHQVTDILIDYTLPGPINGLQLADEFKRKTESLEITITSGYSRSVAFSEWQKRGYRFLGKPFTPQEFLAAFRLTECRSL